MRTHPVLFLVAFLMSFLGAGVASAMETPGPVARYVILVSIDGLRPDAITRLGPERAPNLYRIRTEGAYTDNARTDFHYGNTLPNHMSQLTGRPVLGPDGHGWTTNTTPRPGTTVHSQKGSHIESVFEAVHGAGLRTGAFVTKPKFSVVQQSWGHAIDVYEFDSDSRRIVSVFADEMARSPLTFSFVHIRDPDTQGHRWGWRLWNWHPYMVAVRRADALVGEILAVVEGDPRLAENTVVIVTADHGGSAHGHGARVPEHYTIPFYVWGAGIPAGDLYDVAGGRRADPGAGRPDYTVTPQPIRNGDAANLSLGLVGLEEIGTLGRWDIRDHPEVSGTNTRRR